MILLVIQCDLSNFVCYTNYKPFSRVTFPRCGGIRTTFPSPLIGRSELVSIWTGSNESYLFTDILRVRLVWQCVVGCRPVLEISRRICSVLHSSFVSVQLFCLLCLMGTDPLQMICHLREGTFIGPAKSDSLIPMSPTSKYCQLLFHIIVRSTKENY